MKRPRSAAHTSRRQLAGLDSSINGCKRTFRAQGSHDQQTGAAQFVYDASPDSDDELRVWGHGGRVGGVGGGGVGLACHVAV